MAESLIIKGLTFLADKLISISKTLISANREHRDRIADYCSEIADTLQKAYDDLERGHVPNGCCSAMDQYMRNLRDVLQKAISESDFESLRDVLAVGYQVEHIDQELPSPPRPGTKYAELEIAAGKFRAVAHKIRATRR